VQSDPTKNPATNNPAHQGCYHDLDRPIQQQWINCLDLRALQRPYGGTRQFNHNRRRHGTVHTGGPRSERNQLGRPIKHHRKAVLPYLKTNRALTYAYSKACTVAPIYPR